MRTLAAGGAGFIGSNLVDALLARGDDVTVVDNLSTGRRENLDGALAAGAELAELDIREAAALAELAARASRAAAPPACWGGCGREGRRGSSSPPPAARSTARARASNCRSTRARRSGRSPPTARGSSPARGSL